MSDVTLKSTIKITKILKKTNSEFFRDFVCEDLIVIKTPFCRHIRNGNSLYATDVELENLSNKQTRKMSMTKARNVLVNNFEFLENN